MIARNEKEKIHVLKKKREREREKKHLGETEAPCTTEKITIRGETNSQDEDKYRQIRKMEINIHSVI